MIASMFARFLDMLKAAFESIREGLLFIGGPYDFAIALLDITVLSFILYFILKIVRDSRAWQLLKGIILIGAVSFFANFAGLNTVGWVLNNTISVFAIAVIVIFQPELRRALETVGRSGLSLISPLEMSQPGREQQLIEAIVTACEEMASKRTGALIILERTTPLGDLAEQENAIALDAAVSATLLKQIFYVGSPLHDGAVVIREGKIAVARVHVPLSDNYHLRTDLGTRHRAAIGASEIGDTVSIVCSEERGTMSIALEGRLYTMDHADQLRSNLYRLLLPERQTEGKHKHLKLSFNRSLLRQTLSQPKRGLILASILISTGFWFFVQNKMNPIQVSHYQVPLLFYNNDVAEGKGLRVQIPVESIQVSLKARKSFFDSLSERDIRAYIDLAQLQSPEIKSLPVQVETNSNVYYQVENLLPQQITVNARPLGKTTQKTQP